MDFDAKLNELFIDLPEPVTIKNGFAHAVALGKILYVGGQLPFADGRLMAKGRVGFEVKLDTAKLAARMACIHALAVIAAQSNGTLNHVKRIIRVEGHLATGGDFADHDKVMSGASELLTAVFGKFGAGTCVVTGVASLPQNAPVMISMLVEMK